MIQQLEAKEKPSEHTGSLHQIQSENKDGEMSVLGATPIGRGLLRSVGLIILILSCATASTVIPPKSTLLPTKSNFAATQGTPSFSIRLSNETSQVCNSSTPGVSGFIDSNIGDDESHTFFWLFDSKNDPSSDPLILWMTGYATASPCCFHRIALLIVRQMTEALVLPLQAMETSWSWAPAE